MDIDIFEKYSSLFDPGIPDYIFFLSFWAMSLIIAILLIVKKGIDIKRMVMGTLLVECIFFIYCSTVIYRETFPEPQYNFMLFWSYQAIKDGDDMYIVENCLNVILFIPVGFPGLWIQKDEQMWRWLFWDVSSPVP